MIYFSAAFWGLAFVENCVRLKYNACLLWVKQKYAKLWDRLQSKGEKKNPLILSFCCFSFSFSLIHLIINFTFLLSFFPYKTYDRKRMEKKKEKKVHFFFIILLKEIFCTTKQNKQNKQSDKWVWKNKLSLLKKHSFMFDIMVTN